MRNFLPSLKSVIMFSALAATALVAVQSAWALDAAGEGRRAWLQYNCYGCHAMNGAGGMGPNVVRESGELRDAVLNGKGGGMPAYNQIITEQEVTNLITYINTMGTASEPKFMHWWEPTPSQ